jgi:penicillin-binding protein 2
VSKSQYAFLTLKILVVSVFLVGFFQNANFAATPTKKTGKAAPSKKKRAIAPIPIYDPTDGDNVDAEDLVVRRAAVEALGPMKGSVVVVDPRSGRILTMVNQKLGLVGAYEPCSTIKLVTSLAALNEHLIERSTPVHLTRTFTLNLTNALAHSNNEFFALLGNRLGFDRVTRYARLLGLGDKAGLNISGEHSGALPEAPPKFGGVGLMTSFGTGIQMTPLELAALLSYIANGGTLYYLQYPRTPSEVSQFAPKIKRELDITADQISDVRVGMRGAVDFGTARRAGDGEDPVLGKTGTCTDTPTLNHMGWFGSFNEPGHNQLVIVVMLVGSRAFSGPFAAGVAGGIYRRLSEQGYFERDTATRFAIPAIIATHPSFSALASK